MRKRKQETINPHIGSTSPRYSLNEPEYDEMRMATSEMMDLIESVRWCHALLKSTDELSLCAIAAAVDEPETSLCDGPTLLKEPFLHDNRSKGTPCCISVQLLGLTSR